MTNPLGHDINGKPIYVGSLVMIVRVHPDWQKMLYKTGTVTGLCDAYPGDVNTDILVPGYPHSRHVANTDALMAIDPLSEDTQEERELEHVI